jgi:outer membrane protein OmpA-like peptidoglycan-associated protein
MVNVKLMDKLKIKRIYKTNSEGTFTMCVSAASDIQLIAEKEGYSSNEITISKDKLTGAETVKIPLSKKMLNSQPRFDSTKIKITLSGTVFNEGTKQPMEGVSITLENLKTHETKNLMTHSNGEYHFDLMYNTNYRISASKDKCGSNWNEVSTAGIRTSQDLKQGIGMYCTGDVVKIDNIYYDVDKSNIRPDAALELDKSVIVLNKYPSMKIELRSHTDCRAPNDYNLSLSQRRAESAVAYLISKGIDAKRMVAKGYGETLLTNKCADGVPCTDEEHQANRRTEFKINGF